MPERADENLRSEIIEESELQRLVEFARNISQRDSVDETNSKTIGDTAATNKPPQIANYEILDALDKVEWVQSGRQTKQHLSNVRSP